MNSAVTFSTFPCLTITSFPILVMTLKGVFRGPYQIYDGAFFAQIINSSKQVHAFAKKAPPQIYQRVLTTPMTLLHFGKLLCNFYYSNLAKLYKRLVPSPDLNAE